MDFEVIALLSTSLVFLILWLFVLLKGPKNTSTRVYSFHILSVLVWTFGLAMFYYNPDLKIALFWTNVLYVAGSLIAASFLHFSYIFPSDKPSISISKQVIIYLPNIILFYFFFFTPVIVKEVFFLNGVKGFMYGSGHILWDLQFDIAFLLSFIRFIRMYKQENGLVKARLRYVILGTLIALLWAGATNVMMPWFAMFKLLWSAPVVAIIWLAFVVYAIVKYRLMDIKIALTRASIFIIVYLLVLGIPFGLAGWRRPWLISRFGENWFLAPMFILLGFATAGPFIYQYLRKRTEDLILKEQKAYQRALLGLSKTMARIRDIDQLLKAIVLTVVDKVKVSSAGIYLKNEDYKGYQLKHYYPKKEKESFPGLIQPETAFIDNLLVQKKPLAPEEAGLQDKINLGSGLVIPCFIEEDLLGFLCLGHKPNNSMYTPDDLIVFETLSYSTSLAIENCHFWREIEDRQRKARLQEMDTYSYSLAHEIDNPIQVVLGQAELLKKYLLKETGISEDKQKEVCDSLDFISESAKRVSGMVRAIRDFGQKTTGEFKPLDIEDVVETFSKLYYPKFKEKTVFFKKTSKLKNPVFVRGEKPELMQALFILADNSIHALTGLKEKKIYLSIEAANGDWVRISFSDNGYGIKKENLEIIFKPFVTTKASTEGTGMGLHNAKKIIEKHKGRIWAESEGPDKGATFIIELPVAKDIKPEELKNKDKGKRVF